jgi:hypothetical protein
MAKKISLLLALLYLTGCCCPVCEPTIHYSPSGLPFPTRWGKPPEIQTKDYRLLPYGYGHGSSTLYNWIIQNKESEGWSRFNELPNTGSLVPHYEK